MRKGKHNEKEQEKIYDKIISIIEKGYESGKLTTEQKKKMHRLRKYEKVKEFLNEMKEEIKLFFSEHKKDAVERQKIAKKFRCFFRIASRECKRIENQCEDVEKFFEKFARSKDSAKNQILKSCDKKEDIHAKGKGNSINEEIICIKEFLFQRDKKRSLFNDIEWLENKLSTLQNVLEKMEEMHAAGKLIVFDIGEFFWKVRNKFILKYEDEIQGKRAFRNMFLLRWGYLFKRYLFPKTDVSILESNPQRIYDRCNLFINMYELCLDYPGMKTNNIAWSFIKEKGVGAYRNALEDLKNCGNLPRYLIEN